MQTIKIQNAGILYTLFKTQRFSFEAQSSLEIFLITWLLGGLDSCILVLLCCRQVYRICEEQRDHIRISRMQPSNEDKYTKRWRSGKEIFQDCLYVLQIRELLGGNHYVIQVYLFLFSDIRFPELFLSKCKL